MIVTKWCDDSPPRKSKASAKGKSRATSITDDVRFATRNQNVSDNAMTEDREACDIRYVFYPSIYLVLFLYAFDQSRSRTQPERFQQRKRLKLSHYSSC